MKTSDLSPRLPSFHCLKEQGGYGDNDKKGQCNFVSKNISSPHQAPFTITFFKTPLLFSLTSNLFASGAILAWLPHLTKGLVFFSFSLLFCFFFLFPPGKSEHFSRFFFFLPISDFLDVYLLSLPASYTCLPLLLSPFEGDVAQRPRGWQDSRRV